MMIKQNMKEFDINQGFEAIDAEGIKKMRFLVTFCPFLPQNLIFLTPLVIAIVQWPSGSRYAIWKCVFDNIHKL